LYLNGSTLLSIAIIGMSLVQPLEEIVAVGDDLFRQLGEASAKEVQSVRLGSMYGVDVVIPKACTWALEQDLMAFQLETKVIEKLVRLYEDCSQRHSDLILVHYYSLTQHRHMSERHAQKLIDAMKGNMAQWQSQVQDQILHAVEGVINALYGDDAIEEACSLSVTKTKEIDADSSDHSDADTVEEEEEIEKEVQRVLGGGKRPGRKLFPARAVFVLNTAYRYTTHPCIQTKLRLSQATGLTARQIATWFQNTRSREAARLNADEDQGVKAEGRERRTERREQPQVEAEVCDVASSSSSSCRSSSRSPSPLNANLLPTPPSRHRTPTLFPLSSLEATPAIDSFADINDRPPPYSISAFRPSHIGDAYLTAPMTEAEIWSSFTNDPGSSSSAAVISTENAALLNNPPEEQAFGFDWSSAFL
jgi:hypothetical protein